LRGYIQVNGHILPNGTTAIPLFTAPSPRVQAALKELNDALIEAAAAVSSAADSVASVTDSATSISELNLNQIKDGPKLFEFFDGIKDLNVEDTETHSQKSYSQRLCVIVILLTCTGFDSSK
jgi:ribonuclease D